MSSHHNPIHCGGWTLVLKINSLDSTTLRYDSSYWSNDILLNNTDTSLTLNQNMKNLGFSVMPVNLVKFCMTSTSNCKIENKVSTSLKTILNTTSTTKYTRNDFISWIPTSSSNWTNEPNCNHIGYNISGGSAGGFYGCRFGISMNNENDCLSNDASIGIGCGTNNFATTDRYSSSGGNQWSPNLNYQYQGWIFIK